MKRQKFWLTPWGPANLQFGISDEPVSLQPVALFLGFGILIFTFYRMVAEFGWDDR